jgi:hypothetical protein
MDDLIVLLRVPVPAPTEEALTPERLTPEESTGTVAQTPDTH